MRPLKKSTSQLYTLTGRSSRAIFSRRVECRTVSKALLKSKEMTVTDGLERSMFVMMLRRHIIAAHGEPVGRNANWSENDRVVGGGDRKVGYGNSRTTVFSIILVRTGVIEMGRKSACCLGGRDFGMGMMLACFHCCGMVDVTSDRLKR